MNKRLIRRLMCERVKGLRNSGVYFFSQNFEYIIRGVVLEYVSKGVYISDFKFPLFDFAGPNLLYSVRFSEHPFIEGGEMSEDAVVDYIVNSPEARCAFGANSRMSISKFVQYLQGSDCLLNPHARLINAAALVLLDQGESAQGMLGEILPTLHASDVHSSNRLMISLRQGSGAAKELLDEVRKENMKILGLI